ncbi:MAG: excinuclease ABC subunit UvrB [Alkalibacterium sp.]|nr:excinuclease ABC subunit UvrB [Alkalibacterium sp.]
MAEQSFNLKSLFEPSGDQPEAIKKLVKGINENQKEQVLLGATGTGKTFTMSNVIQQVNKPTLVMAHNKTLAGQLYTEFKEFFPDNAVEYFVSYYDYYQPEAYVPSTDTFIEKDASINDEIDKLADTRRPVPCSKDGTSSLCSSVSCIYGLVNPEDYREHVLSLRSGMEISREDLLRKLVDMQFERNDIDFQRGRFRVRGDIVEIFLASRESEAVRVEFFGDEIDRIREVDVLTGEVKADLAHAAIFPATHFVSNDEQTRSAIEAIQAELKDRLEELHKENKMLEAQRLEQRTNYDIEMLMEMGYCSGIENYSRHMDGRKPGEAPYTLLDFFPKDSLFIIDESHMTMPQIRGMYNGDRARKQQLIDHGFRLPSALDNRPLRLEEFEERVPQINYISATPAEYEMSRSSQIVEQIIRPTGLLDPVVEVRPIKGQIDDIIEEINKRIEKNERVFITTLTKKMSEDLTRLSQGSWDKSPVPPQRYQDAGTDTDHP